EHNFEIQLEKLLIETNMFSHDSPRLAHRMEKAQKILGEIYPYFQNLIINYSIRCDTPYWDIACYLTNVKLKNKKRIREKWISFWTETTKTRRVYGNFVYYVPVSYYHFDFLQDPEVFFISILEAKVEESKELSWEDYVWLFFKKRDMVKPIFTKIEFQLFKDILTVQSLSNLDLKKTAWESITNLSKYKKRVLNKGVLFQGFSLNSIKLSLANHNILLSLAFSEKDDFQKLLTPNSYLNFIQTGGIGCKNVLLNFVVPDLLEVEEDLQTLKKLLEKRYPRAKICLFQLERKTKLVSFNFSSYKYKDGRWEFFPYLQRLFLEKGSLTEKEREVPIREEFTDFSKIKLKLNRPLLNFINTLINIGHISTSKIAQKTNLKSSTVKRYLKYLFDKQIIKTRINPMVIFGLASIVLFLDYPKEMQRSLHNFLSIFIETYSEIYNVNKEEGILFVLRCPKENVLSTTEILRKIFRKKIRELFVVDQFYSKRFQFPVERYDPYTQKWEYEKKDLFGDLENG
ncbi:MAG: hypothetical protein ACTSP3_11100, partial [Candidatus Heimdallarchaeaceae archaeon]